MPTGEHCLKKNSGAQWARTSNLWIQSLTRHYFPSDNVCLLAYTYIQVKTHNQNEGSVTNQTEYTGFRQDSYLMFICRLFYRKDPALTLSKFAAQFDTIILCRRSHPQFDVLIMDGYHYVLILSYNN